MEGMGHIKASFLYDAAYAAFKLWGDCELARQYLLLGSKLNPIVLVKILGKVEQQSEFPDCTPMSSF